MRYLLLLIISFITFIILLFNFRLYAENYSYEEKKNDIIHQLNFLERELKNNSLGDEMQRIFPEGFVFVNAMYGLSWCELALCDSKDKALHDKAISESLYAFDAINSEKGKRGFDNSLKPGYGIYYSGWRNYLLSKILSADTTAENLKAYRDSFEVRCDNIKNALRESENPYLESYTGSAWPADMFVAMASLSIHDKIFPEKYKNEINSWLLKVRSRLDPVTMMIPHEADPKTGQSIVGARGSSMCLMLRLLAETDPGFALKQYKLFKSNFVSKTFGLPSVREYPKGQNGNGDIDSGPVIFGVGFAATIVATGTFALFNDDALAEEQYKTVNAFGFSWTSGDQKKYLLGRLPIADAFIALGRATALKQPGTAINPEPGWRIKFNLLSLGIIAILWIPFFWKRILVRLNSIAILL